MRKLMLVVSLAGALTAMVACNNNSAERQAVNEPLKQEREFLRQAI